MRGRFDANEFAIIHRSGRMEEEAEREAHERVVKLKTKSPDGALSLLWSISMGIAENALGMSLIPSVVLR